MTGCATHICPKKYNLLKDSNEKFQRSSSLMQRINPSKERKEIFSVVRIYESVNIDTKAYIKGILKNLIVKTLDVLGIDLSKKKRFLAKEENTCYLTPLNKLRVHVLYYKKTMATNAKLAG